MSFKNMIHVLKLDVQDRKEDDLNRIARLLQKTSYTFRGIDKAATKNVVREAKYISVPKRVVITQQGEQGNCFYIVVSGSVTVYQQKQLDTDDEPTNIIGDDTIQSLDTSLAKDLEIKQYPPNLHASTFGNYVTTVEPGRIFGELALMSKDGARTATVVAIEGAELLHLGRQVYLNTLLDYHTKELILKREFIDKSRLFRDWPQRQKTNFAVTVCYYKLPTGGCVVSQGDPLNGIHFLIKGQVKLIVNNYQHPKQFEKLAGELKTITSKTSKRKSMSDVSCLMKVERKKQEATQDKQKHRKSFLYDLCILGSLGIIGDLEIISDLDKFFCTAICIEDCELLFLEYTAFDSFFNRRHRDSRQRFCDRARLKAEQLLSSMSPGAVPLMTAVKMRLEKTKTQLLQSKTRMKAKDLVPVRKINKLPRGPIINNFGPGGLFYIIALQNRHVWEAAAEREMTQRHEATYKQTGTKSEKHSPNNVSTISKSKKEESAANTMTRTTDEVNKINEVIFDWYEILEQELNIPFGKCNIVLDEPEPPQF